MSTVSLSVSEIETAATDVRQSAWFKALSKVAQLRYLQKHPSKQAGAVRRKRHATFAQWHLKKARTHHAAADRFKASAKSLLKKSRGAPPAKKRGLLSKAQHHATASNLHRGLADQHKGQYADHFIRS